MRQINRMESFNVLLVLAQKLPARWKIIVDHVERFTIDPRLQAGEHDRFGTVVHISKRNRISATHMQKQTKGPKPHPAGDAFVPRAVHISRSHNHVWDS